MKILYVASVVKTHIAQFHIPYLKMLKEMGWETAVAARNDYEDPKDCVIPYCDTYFDVPFERNPFHPGNLKAYKQLKKIIDEGQYDIIHCHTPIGAMVTRMAAGHARRNGSKVFYTAHGFHFYKGAPLINWILYYPVEQILSRKTDLLITIAKEDYKRAQHFHAKKTVYIPGIGIDRSRFHKKDPLKSASIKEELGIPQDVTVLLSVGEAVPNKNHKIVIEALPDFPDVWYVLCGSGPLLEKYRKLAKRLGVSERVILAGYRKDNPEFYSMADLFVHPSIREGLPVALMEAMASELPCVASHNRGTDELLSKSKLLFDPTNIGELKEKLRTAMQTDCSEEIRRNSRHIERFDLAITLNLVKDFYLSETAKR